MSQDKGSAQGAGNLEKTALELVRGKGILAADESAGTIEKRFDQIGVPSTEEKRRFYREMLFTVDGDEEFISGVILFDETISQQASDGTPLLEVLTRKGIIPGIKVDQGLKNLANSKGEKIAEGLDGLRKRLAEYRALGARFAKWRTVYSVGEGFPTTYCIEANAHVQAYYAALCVESDLVPIVEPEVLMDGNHTIQQCYDATKRTLSAVFSHLSLYGVPLRQMLLKTNMVLSGSEAAPQADEHEVALKTLECFRETLPNELPGILFLSGGQTERQATSHLNAINVLGRNDPWHLSFSYGRALQASALKAWKGQPENRQKAQQAYLHRASLNGAAVHGRYRSDME